MNSPILAPAVALVLWTLLVLAGLALTRLPAMRKAGIDLGTLVGNRGSSLEGVVPDQVNWVAHNYEHLVEQPTLFYAIVCILALQGQGEGTNLALAWAYVLLRVLHTIVQVTWNRVAVRFAVFSAGTAALVALAVNAARATNW